MPVPERIESLIAAGRLDAVEDAWLARLDETPADLDFFVSTAERLASEGEQERARMLLELVDEQLRETDRWATRLELLRRAGTLLLASEDLHPAVLATLETLHGESELFAPLAERVGLHRAVDDLRKTWEKVERLERLMCLDVGTIVWMNGKGAGRVVEVNLDLQSFRVDFERNPGLAVGFRGAPKLLDILAPDHVLRRKIEEPEELRRLSEDDPGELLHQVLESYGRPLSAGEIRDALSGIVEESQWTSWWGKARKHPQVVVGTGGRQTYSWAASDEAARDAAWSAFAAAEPRKRIELLRRLGSRDEELADRMRAELVAQGRAALAGDPGLAFELAVATRRSGGAEAAGDLTPEALISGSADPRELVAGVADRTARDRAYRLLRELRDDWEDVFADQLLVESDARLLDLLAGELGAARPERLGRLLDDILAQPRRQRDAFLWLAERAREDEELRARNPLRLLQQILLVLADDEWSSGRQRLHALLEPGGTVPRLLPHLSADQASAADEVVRRAAGMEEYERTPLINALHLRFPALRPEASEGLYATRESIETRRAELDRITRQELPANRRAIQEARALGDLRENFEYKAARQRHEYLSARATALERDLRRVRPIDPAAVEATEVRIGTRVVLERDAEQRSLTLLGPWESRPEADVISYESDLGRRLLGKKVGDEATVGDGPPWRLAAIEPVG